MLALATVRIASAQTSPEQSGLRFGRLAAKTADTLAAKAGGLTERIEIQTTDDHIDYVVKTYKIENANAAEVYQFVVNAVALEGGFVDRTAGGGKFEATELKDERGAKRGVSYRYAGDSFLVVTAPKWMIPYIDETIEMLDVEGLQSSAFGTGYAYFFPRHRRPSELVQLIGDSVASGVHVFVPDDSRNLLYLEDTPSYVELILEALEIYDRPPDQFEAHVRIYEIDDTKGMDLGLDWYAWKKGLRGGDLTATFDNSENPGSFDLALTSLTGELSFTPQLASEFLNYLVESGDARIITDTRITAINGKTATVSSVLQIPFVIRGFIGHQVVDTPLRDSPPAVFPDGSIKEFTEGVTLSITPTIGTETVELVIEATVSSHVGYTPNQNVPLIATSSASSIIDVVPGRPAVLSGLNRVSRVTERQGIPWLKTIPWLCYLVSREVEREHKTQVVITITPTVIEPGRAIQGLPAEALAGGFDADGWIVDGLGADGWNAYGMGAEGWNAEGEGGDGD